MPAVVMALVSLAVTVGAVEMAPRWFTALAHGGVVQPASPSQMHPTPPVERRSIPVPPAAHMQNASLQMQDADLTPNVPLRFVGSGFRPGEALLVTIQGQEGQLDAYSAKPGHAIGFVGSGFMPNETLEVCLGTADQVVATANTNARGNVAGRFTVPPLPEGNHTLFFAGLQSQAPASVGFNVQGFHPWVVLDSYAPSPHTRLGNANYWHGLRPRKRRLKYGHWNHMGGNLTIL